MNDTLIILITIALFSGAILFACALCVEIFPDSRISKVVAATFGGKNRYKTVFSANDVISMHDLAGIEKNISNLREVIVISARVDAPSRSLHDAVLDNFQQGASYTFYVSSNGHTDEELNHYRNWFQAIFDSAVGMAPAQGENSKIRDLQFAELFSVRRLGIEWATVPFIFYIYDDEEKGKTVFAVRGMTEGVGISSYYQALDSKDAMAIIELSGSASTNAFAGLQGQEIAFSDSLSDEDVANPISNVLIANFDRR
ncbi:MAG: hypothetical protein ACKOPQ_13950 [Novosphingobium sp.]